MAQLPSRSSSTKPAKAKAGGMAPQNDFSFPVLFTIDGSNRHEVILVNPGLDLDQLKQAIEAVLQSPNCAEVLSKYRKQENPDSVGDVRVKWSSEGRDKQLFPKDTLLTDDNVEPVLRLMSSSGVGRDTFDIKIQQQAASSGASKESGGAGAGAPAKGGPPKKPATPKGSAPASKGS